MGVILKKMIEDDGMMMPILLILLERWILLSAQYMKICDGI